MSTLCPFILGGGVSELVPLPSPTEIFNTAGSSSTLPAQAWPLFPRFGILGRHSLLSLTPWSGSKITPENGAFQTPRESPHISG